MAFEKPLCPPADPELAAENEKLKQLVGELTLKLNNGNSIL